MTLIVLASACGRPDGPGKSTAPENAPASGAEPASYCDRLSLPEIEAAFGDAVSFGDRPSRAEKDECVYSVEDGAGIRQFQFARRDGAGYERAKAAHETSGRFEPVGGIGVDAYLVNESQLEVRVSETEAVMLAVGARIFGGEPPLGPDAKRAGLVQLAYKLIERS